MSRGGQYGEGILLCRDSSYLLEGRRRSVKAWCRPSVKKCTLVNRWLAEGGKINDCGEVLCYNHQNMTEAQRYFNFRHSNGTSPSPFSADFSSPPTASRTRAPATPLAWQPVPLVLDSCPHTQSRE